MFAFSPIRRNELAGFCRRLGTGLEAGVDVRKLLSREAERATGHQRQTLEHVAERIGQGETTEAAIRDTQDAFPRLFHDLVHVGEQTGKLDMILLRLADHYEHMQTLQRIFLAGITWPMIQLAMAIGVIGLMILFLGMVEPDPDFPIRSIAFGLYGVNGLLIFLGTLAGLGVAVWVLISSWRRGRLGAAVILPLFYRIPGLGNCLQTMALGRMAWTLSLTTDTPMDVFDAIHSSLNSTGTSVYTRLEPAIRDQLMAGAPIHTAFRATRAFPNDFVDAIEIGEEAGRLSESLYKLSERDEEQARAAAKALTVIGSVLVWIAVSAVIIYFILSIALLYAGMITKMSQPGWI